MVKATRIQIAMVLSGLFVLPCLADEPSTSTSNSTPNASSKPASNRKRSPEQQKYGQAATHITTIQSSLKDARGTLEDSDSQYFQQRFADLQEKAEKDVAANGPAANQYVDGLKQLQEELSANIERTKQSNEANLAAMNAAISHLKDSFAQRKSKMSEADQERFQADISDLAARASAVTPSVGSAIRMNSLAEEAGSIEANMAGRSLLPQTSQKFAGPHASVKEEDAQQGQQTEENQDDDCLPIPNTGLVFHEPPKPSIDQLIDSLSKRIESCGKNGFLGTFEQDSLSKRLNEINLLWKSHHTSTGLDPGKELSLRKQIEAL